MDMSSELEERLAAVERLTHLFRFERVVYLCVCVSALFVLLYMAAEMMVREGAKRADVLALFGPTGVITYSTTQLLRMWRDALDRIVPEKQKKRGKKPSSRVTNAN